ncbi:glycosyltransferase family 2 protein [Actinomadura sp. CNU-125]|uniref:glycosyltransferase family 2 protein n=1 Tax=Actinomadura sp. CNU-125 TaxID=1904961 RepID=UPI00096A88AE|nr:glycosyltransferase [Actinomadura sp. CNU-125]
MDCTVVVPTIGRESLRTTLRALLAALDESAHEPHEIIVVDDRPVPGTPLPLPDAGRHALRVLRSGGRGPAAARNTGWRAAATEWIAFLDDDVVPGPRWPQRLAADLADLPPEVGGSQGRVVVPRPEGRRPTDWERNTTGLETAAWITADMAYRRGARRRRRLRRTFPPRLPRGRRPGPARPGHRSRPRPGNPRGRAPGPSRRLLGVRPRPGGQRRRRPDAAPARPVLARPRRRRPRPPPRTRPDHDRRPDLRRRGGPPPRPAARTLPRPTRLGHPARRGHQAQLGPPTQRGHPTRLGHPTRMDHRARLDGPTRMDHRARLDGPARFG